MPNDPPPPPPALYSDLASWWPTMNRPQDYEEEAGIYVSELQRLFAPRKIRTVLELGSGGGNNAVHMKAHFESMTLVDLSDGMLDVSRELNPDLEHLQGDMCDLRLGRTFDAVFIHDAIQYLRPADRLRAAFRTARAHLEPGGVALFAPPDTTETFEAMCSRGGWDDGDRSFRFLGWQLPVEEPDGDWFRLIYTFMLREHPDEEMRLITDEHHLGLFPRASWLEWIAEAEFEVGTIPYTHSSVDDGEDRVLFFGRVGGSDPVGS